MRHRLWSVLALFTGLALFFEPSADCSASPPAAIESGSSYLHQSWTTENGLPQNSVTAIVRTRDGHLWLGTYGGLVRFDGVEFTVFNTLNTPALRSNRIRALYEDDEGDLWIGAEHGGLTRFRDGVFTNFSPQDGLPDDIVVSITGDTRGDLWIATTSGIARWHKGNFSSYGIPPALRRENIYVICRAPDGDLWAGSFADGLILLRGATLKRYSTDDGLPDNQIRSLYVNSAGRLFVGTSSGAAEFDGRRFAPLAARDGSKIGEVRSFFQSREQDLWMGSSAGLFRLKNGELVRFSPQVLSDSNVRSLLADREGNLWIGTDIGGLNRLRKSNLISYTAKNGFINNPTMAIYGDHHGDLWIGALNHAGLFRFTNGAFNPFSSSCVNSIGSLAETRDGSLWIGDWYCGLSVWKNGKIVNYAIPGVSAADAVRSLYVDRNDTLWIGSDRFGLYRFRNGEFKNYRTSAGLAGNHISFITQDSNGALWVGTAVGISRFEQGKFISYHAPGLSLIRNIYVDSDNTLWIGTYGFGLTRYKNGKFTQITSKNGLFEDVVSCVVEDDRNNLWMSGNRGIFRAARNELNEFADGVRKSITSVSYGVADGMDVSETNGGGEPTCWRAQDGKLWFAMIKGVVVIDPNQVNRFPPPVVIEQVSVDGRALPPGQAIQLKPGSRNLEIHYAGLSFSRPEQVKFRYRLLGLDPEWVNAEARRTAYFPHLPAGKYTFNVIADNGDGVWNTEGASLAITVVPPFWRTSWFLAFLVVAIAAASTLAYRLRVSHLMKIAAKDAMAREAFSRQLLDSQEKERQRIAAELHDGLGQSLLIIKNRALVALNATGEDEPSREQLEEISSSASYAVEEVREICYNLRPYQLDRFGLTKTLNGMCQRASRISGIEFEAHLDSVDGLFSNEGETAIYRIVQEAINNSIKHSGATNAELLIKRAGDQLKIDLRDNGRGFIPSAENLTGTSGGFGLIGIAERVRMLGGTYAIDSAPGSGTGVKVILPIPKTSHET